MTVTFVGFIVTSENSFSVAPVRSAEQSSQNLIPCEKSPLDYRLLIRSDVVAHQLGKGLLLELFIKCYQFQINIP